MTNKNHRSRMGRGSSPGLARRLTLYSNYVPHFGRDFIGSSDEYRLRFYKLFFGFRQEGQVGPEANRQSLQLCRQDPIRNVLSPQAVGTINRQLTSLQLSRNVT